MERYRSMAGFQIVLEVSPEVEEVRLPSAAEIQVMRIIQEALSNVRKHAKATQVVVKVSRTGDELRIEVSDNGSGFDPATRLSTGWPRFGLQTMRERAEAVGGAFSVQSAPGRGTKVMVILPAGLA